VRAYLPAVLLFAALFGLSGCGGDSETPPGRTAGLAPGDGFLGLWNRDGETKVFDGAGLYGHINGGAEVFLELGFSRLEVQRYTSGKEDVILEIYHMDDPAAALGIYLMKCGRETPDHELTVRHTVNRYQLQLLRGSVYLTVSNPEAGEEAARCLTGFARHVVDRLTRASDPAADPLAIFDSLPVEGRVAGSERVIRGPFTLQAVYTFGKGDVLSLEAGVTAVAADYEDQEDDTYTAILASYPGEAEAAAALRHAAESFDSTLEILYRDTSELVFRDHAGRYGKLGISGTRLLAAVNLARRP
jgi:hypothetical protein